MRGVHAGAFQGEPCPGPEDTEPVSHSSKVLYLLLLRCRERPRLGFARKLAHPLLILIAKPEAKDLAGQFGREIAVAGLHDPTDGGFAERCLRLFNLNL